jgi:hypothetical protein
MLSEKELDMIQYRVDIFSRTGRDDPFSKTVSDRIITGDVPRLLVAYRELARRHQDLQSQKQADIELPPDLRTTLFECLELFDQMSKWTVNRFQPGKVKELSERGKSLIKVRLIDWFRVAEKSGVK